MFSLHVIRRSGNSRSSVGTFARAPGSLRSQVALTKYTPLPGLNSDAKKRRFIATTLFYRFKNHS